MSLFSFPGNASCCVVLLVIAELYIMVAFMFFRCFNVLSSAWLCNTLQVHATSIKL